MVSVRFESEQLPTLINLEKVGQIGQNSVEDSGCHKPRYVIGLIFIMLEIKLILYRNNTPIGI